MIITIIYTVHKFLNFLISNNQIAIGIICYMLNNNTIIVISIIITVLFLSLYQAHHKNSTRMNASILIWLCLFFDLFCTYSQFHLFPILLVCNHRTCFLYGPNGFNPEMNFCCCLFFPNTVYTTYCKLYSKIKIIIPVFFIFQCSLPFSSPPFIHPHSCSKYQRVLKTPVFSVLFSLHPPPPQSWRVECILLLLILSLSNCPFNHAGINTVSVPKSARAEQESCL